ncbi:NAD(P)H-binding protein [Amycolatopsis sp. NPDC049253]|uniref:NAD-dependent epimerase/dehydratase family protein n=1 Tax=Amycolatopsis sp. NPDC049253 TaxID=3155274 RepID=UPI0034153CD7
MIGGVVVLAVAVVVSVWAPRPGGRVGEGRWTVRSPSAMIFAMKILVVGGSGLLGHHVLEQLRLRGHEATTVARTPREGVDRVLDVTTASEDDLRELLAGHDGVVFAGGSDDRRVDKGPVAPRLHAGNVAPVVALLKAAREVGCTRAAVLASYYTYFDRVHPEWGLAAKHPYVRSRIEQAKLARESAGPDLPVAIIEVPYVFGVAPGRVPEWSVPVVKWVRSSAPLFAPRGGSAATSARGVGIVTVDALEDGSGADIPVVEETCAGRTCSPAWPAPPESLVRSARCPPASSARCSASAVA